MVTKLERITGKTCVHKVRAMQMAYVPPELEHCRNNCVNDYKDTCPNYRPVSEFNIRIKGMKEYYETTNIIS